MDPIKDRADLIAFRIWIGLFFGTGFAWTMFVVWLTGWPWFAVIFFTGFEAGLFWTDLILTQRLLRWLVYSISWQLAGGSVLEMNEFIEPQLSEKALRMNRKLLVYFLLGTGMLIFAYKTGFWKK